MLAIDRERTHCLPRRQRGPCGTGHSVGQQPGSGPRCTRSLRARNAAGTGGGQIPDSDARVRFGRSRAPERDVRPGGRESSAPARARVGSTQSGKLISVKGGKEGEGPGSFAARPRTWPKEPLGCSGTWRGSFPRAKPETAEGENGSTRGSRLSAEPQSRCPLWQRAAGPWGTRMAGRGTRGTEKAPGRGLYHRPLRLFAPPALLPCPANIHFNTRRLQRATCDPRGGVRAAP